MGFLITCTNKGCGQSMEPILDTASNIVYCTNCNKPMNGITEFTKSQMKFFGQVKKSAQQYKLFGFVCPLCNKRSYPKIINNKVCCEECNRDVESKLAPQLIHGIKQTLR